MGAINVAFNRTSLELKLFVTITSEQVLVALLIEPVWN